MALRSDNGTELWNQPLSHTTRVSALSEIRDIAGRPVVYKGDVFAISHADVMADTDLRTGEVHWTLPVSGFTSPWAAGDVVFAVGDDGQVLCAARDSGQLYWLTDLDAAQAPTGKHKKPTKRSSAVWSSPILANGRLITVSDKGEAVAINAKTGVVEQRLKIGDDALLRRYDAFAGRRYPVAERLGARGLYLPSGPRMGEAEVARVADALVRARES